MDVVEQQIVETLRSLPAEEQQQVLDFAEFLRMRFLKIRGQVQSIESQPSERSISVLEAAGDLVGCIEGPGDLSTNQQYMAGFGQS